jgi:hypothetical protein
VLWRERVNDDAFHGIMFLVCSKGRKGFDKLRYFIVAQ